MDMLEKAVKLNADQVLFDLEDAVASDEKAAARENTVTAVEEFDWGNTLLTFRMNDLSLPYAYRDLVTVVEAVGDRMDTVTVPKVRSAEDIHVVDTLLEQIETQVSINDPVGIQLLIEETEAIQNVDEIAAASDRIETLEFGSGDYSASLGVDHPSAQSDPRDTSDQWHYARQRILNAARSNGLDAIDGAYPNFSDIEGYRRECETANEAGYVGKWAIHPDQISVANEVFTPSQEEIEHAERVLQALDEGESEGAGAVDFDGVMIDNAHRRHANRTLSIADELGLR
jgi:citrate lyase subunit beta/citryl-CoA lyase